MSISKTLKYSLLSLFFVTLQVQADGGKRVVPCRDIEVTVKTQDTSEGQSNGEISLDYPDTKDSYTYFIFSGDEQANQLKGTGKKITNLKQGTYNLYVQNQDGCTKHFKLKIN